MSATILVDEKIDSYHGDALEMVLVGADLWPEFIAETGLVPEPVGSNDFEVIHRGIACRPSVVPDVVNLVLGD